MTIAEISGAEMVISRTKEMKMMSLQIIYQEKFGFNNRCSVVVSIQQTVIVVSRVDQLLSSYYTKPT